MSTDEKTTVEAYPDDATELHVLKRRHGHTGVADTIRWLLQERDENLEE